MFIIRGCHAFQLFRIEIEIIIFDRKEYEEDLIKKFNVLLLWRQERIE